MDYFYTIQKLTLAFNDLALGEDDIRYRLVRAYHTVHLLEENDFPENLKEDWIKFENGINEWEPGILDINIRQIYDMEEKTVLKDEKKKNAKVLAKILLELYCKLLKNPAVSKMFA